MRLLIAVISYQGDAQNGNQERIRETWGKDCAAVGADLRFSIARRAPNYEAAQRLDEFLIDWIQTKPCACEWYASKEGCCADFWQKLTKETLKWSLNHGYDYTFLCENDTFLVPRKLMACGFEKYDFSGWFVQGGEKHPWPDPGVGYFMSRRAATMLLTKPPDHWSLGMYAAFALAPEFESGALTKKDLPNFHKEVAWHYRVVTGNGYPVGSPWMKNMYETYGRS